jgi:hypothetical protein
MEIMLYNSSEGFLNFYTRRGNISGGIAPENISEGRVLSRQSFMSFLFIRRPGLSNDDSLGCHA